MMNTGFNEDQLSDNEKAYLGSVVANDVIQLRNILEDLENNSISFNYDCHDFRGRSALHLAVENENIEIIEMLIDRSSYPCVEEALLHSINKDCVKTIRAIIEHPSFVAKCQHAKKHDRKAIDDDDDDDDDDQFPHDVTPLILAAQRNNHEVIQMFLSRNFTIDKPHWVSCACPECSSDREKDSLKRSRSRLNTYKALVSPAYMALSSPDPIMTTFELRQEMKKLAQVEKEFKNEYTSLVEQCMDFACELMDLCRGTQEVEAVLSDHIPGSVPDPLARLKMALKYDEKKFVAHPNCQQHLTSVWYGTEMGFLQSMSPWKQVLFWILGIPVVPFLCLLYLACPDSKVARMLKCPASKFIAHTVSNLFFLLLISMATFSTYQYSPRAVLPHEQSGEGQEVNSIVGRESLYYLTSCQHLHLFVQSNSNYRSRDGEEEESEDELSDELELLLRNTLRSCNALITKVHICLLLYILGMMWTECRQLYVGGLNNYLMDHYNWIDFIVLSLYLSSYTLRLLVNVKVASADWFFGGAASRARRVLASGDLESFREIVLETCNKSASPLNSYFMRASRFEWQMNDPEIISDMLFGLANVWSIARTTYLMPAFEVLGPLQISLGRMMADITRFLVLFALVLLAFMVGLHNLYCYYGAQTFKVLSNGSAKLMHSSESFKDLWRTLLSLFWSMFGLVGLESIEIKHPHLHLIGANHSLWNTNLSIQMHSPSFYSSSSSSPSSSPSSSLSSSSSLVQFQSLPDIMAERPNSTVIVEGVGLFLFALYHVTVIIVLINMLIAMMSHSFEVIQGDCDVEWKFARTNLWMNYIRVGDTLPIPFNMLPSVKTFSSLFNFTRSFFRSRSKKKKDDDYDDEDGCATCVLEKKHRCLGNRVPCCCCCCCCCKAGKKNHDEDEDDHEEAEEEESGIKRSEEAFHCFPRFGEVSRANGSRSKYKPLKSGGLCSTTCCGCRKKPVVDPPDDDDDDDDDDVGKNNLKIGNVIVSNDEAIGDIGGEGDGDDDDDDEGEASQKRVHFIPNRSLDRRNIHHYQHHRRFHRHHHHHHHHQQQQQQQLGKHHDQSSNADILQRLVRRYLFKLERIKDEAKDIVNNLSETTFVSDYLKDRKDSDFRRKPLSSHGSNQSLVLNFPPSTSSGVTTHKPLIARKNRPLSMRRRHQQFYQVQLPPDNLPVEQPTELQPAPKRRPFRKQQTSEQLPVVNEPPKTTILKRSSFSPSPSPSPTSHSPLSPTTTLHLMSLPKIDAIMKSIKNFQDKVAVVGNATLKKDALRDDIRHVEKLLVENCKALSSVLLVLKSVHTEVETLKTLTSLKAKNVVH